MNKKSHLRIFSQKINIWKRAPEKRKQNLISSSEQKAEKKKQTGFRMNHRNLTDLIATYPMFSWNVIAHLVSVTYSFCSVSYVQINVARDNSLVILLYNGLKKGKSFTFLIYFWVLFLSKKDRTFLSFFFVTSNNVSVASG